MTTTISALTGQQPLNADVFEFETGGISSFKSTKAQLHVAGASEALTIANNAGTGSIVVNNDGSMLLTTPSGKTVTVAVGQVALANGVLGAPSLTFAGDLTTGFYSTSSSGVIVFSQGNSNAVCAFQYGSGLCFAAGKGPGWTGGSVASTNPDVQIMRIAVGVLDVTGAFGVGGGWIRNNAGEGALASAFTDATGTLAVTNLLFNVIAGRSYRITGCLQVSNSLAADGVQLNFAGGTASATTFFMTATNIGSVVAGTVVSTTLAGVINYTTVTGTDYILLNGYLKVNAGGTLILQAATNTHVSGTMTLGAGSWIELSDTVRL